MRKIVFFGVTEKEEEYYQNKLFKYKPLFVREQINEKNLDSASDAEIIAPRGPVDQKMIEKMPELKLIVTRSTGFDHIDLDCCKKKKILVANVPSYGERTIAEHTFALILALSRKLIHSSQRTKEGDFSLDGLAGFQLHGKTIGVIGAGHIGKRVIEIARGFGMKVLVFTRNPDKKMEESGVKFVPLDMLLASSDIVTIHVPHNKDTYHLINTQNIRKFKKGSLLINTARGAVVETEAILEGLEQGILKGAGLDVLEEECYLKEEQELLTKEFLKVCNLKTQLLNHVLIKRDDVIITPHNAFNSPESLEQIKETTVENIKSYLEGKPVNIVN